MIAAVNASLTGVFEYGAERLSRFIPQARALWARVSEAARALFSWVQARMDDVERLYMERLYARRVAVRGFFLANPRDPKSPYTTAGKRVLGYWARQCRILNPPQTNDAIEMARVQGMQLFFAMVMSDLYDDLPDFARIMAQEEEEFA